MNIDILTIVYQLFKMDPGQVHTISSVARQTTAFENARKAVLDCLEMLQGKERPNEDRGRYIKLVKEAKSGMVQEDRIEPFVDDVQNIGRKDPDFLAAAFVAALAYERNFSQDFEFPLISKAYTAYSVLKVIRNDPYGQDIEELREKLKDTISKANAWFEDVGAKAAATAEQIIEVSNTMEKFHTETEVLRKEIASTSGDMEGWKDQVRIAATEALKLKSTQTLWADRAKYANRAVMVATVLLVIVLAFVPIAAFYRHERLIQGLHNLLMNTGGVLPNDPNATIVTAYALSRVVIISVPVILYFWIIRLVVRFWTRSLLLLDDARARQTMVATYRQLIEEKGAAPKEDRAIVLSAIYRPMPGHGQDPVEQPSINEYVNNFLPKN